jgi:hypothetical protein
MEKCSILMNIHPAGCTPRRLVEFHQARFICSNAQVFQNPLVFALQTVHPPFMLTYSFSFPRNPLSQGRWVMATTKALCGKLTAVPCADENGRARSIPNGPDPHLAKTDKPEEEDHAEETKWYLAGNASVDHLRSMKSARENR